MQKNPTTALENSPKPALANSGLWQDPFIEELHGIRTKLQNQANNDMHQLVINARLAASQLGFKAAR